MLICFFGLGGRFRNPTSFLDFVAGLQCTKLVECSNAVHRRKYPDILLPRCEHSGGRGKRKECGGIRPRGLGLISCRMTLPKPRSNMAR